MSCGNEVYISVDVEASGPIPGEYSLLSIGACVVYEPERTFECIVKPISDNADPKALEVTGMILADLAVSGLAPDSAMSRFAQWVLEVSGDGSPIFVGLNASFDWSFINYYFVRYHGSNPFGFAALDIKSLYMGAQRCGWRETRSSDMKRRLNAESSGTHDALEDALFQAELFRLIRLGLQSD